MEHFKYFIFFQFFFFKFRNTCKNKKTRQLSLHFLKNIAITQIPVCQEERVWGGDVVSRGWWAQTPRVVVPGAGPFLPDTPVDICSAWRALFPFCSPSAMPGRRALAGAQRAPIFLEAGTGGGVSCGKGGTRQRTELLSGEEAG